MSNQVAKLNVDKSLAEILWRSGWLHMDYLQERYNNFAFSNTREQIRKEAVEQILILDHCVFHHNIVETALYGEMLSEYYFGINEAGAQIP